MYMGVWFPDQGSNIDSSDSESDDEGQRGGRDTLQATQGIDIPLGLNIPVVSELAKY